MIDKIMSRERLGNRFFFFLACFWFMSAMVGKVLEKQLPK